MSEDNSDKSTVDKSAERAKNIWLAGLGAYGRAFDEAHDRYEKASKETSKVFENLVAKGKKLENETQGKLKDVRSKSTSNIDERINKVKETLGFSDGDKGNSIEELNQKIDSLSAKVDQLLEAVTPKAKAKSKTLN